MLFGMLGGVLNFIKLGLGVGFVLYFVVGFVIVVFEGLFLGFLGFVGRIFGFCVVVEINIFDLLKLNFVN